VRRGFPTWRYRTFQSKTSQAPPYKGKVTLVSFKL